MSDVEIDGAQKRIVWASDPSGALLGKEYFEGLPSAERAKLRVILERMADHGQIRNTEKFRHEEGPFYCFKSFKRRLMCFIDGRDVVVTHGFTKKRDRLDRKELERAARIKSAYVRP